MLSRLTFSRASARLIFSLFMEFGGPQKASNGLFRMVLLHIVFLLGH